MKLYNNKEFYEEMKKTFGSVPYGEIVLALTEHASAYYGTDGDVRYYANALDLEGVTYGVQWETTADWDSRDNDDKTDEGDACDWDCPRSIRLI